MPTKKTASQIKADVDNFLKFPREPWEKKIDKRRGQRVATWLAALKRSPAIIVTSTTGRRDLVLRTGEMQNRGEGKLRATVFGTDGPRYHVTRDTDRELADELATTWGAVKSIRPASEAEVMTWTSSCEFSRGSKLVALNQASNTLRFRGSKTGKYARASEIDSKAFEVARTDVDRALAMLEAGIKEIG